jgi:membrane associated rhomboid family serine protease
MLPIGDDNRDRRTTPVVTWILIAINVLVFVLLQGMGTNDNFTYAWSTVPAEIVSGRDLVTQDQTIEDPATGQRFTAPGLRPTPVSVYLTLLFSMFMHGSLAHLGGNMLYLYIFGDNVEDRLGRLRYLIFYLVCGLAASLSHIAVTYLFGGDPRIASLGASGAISGVLGGYWLLFPQRQVNVVLGNRVTAVSSMLAIGIWFVFQLISGVGMLGGGGRGSLRGTHQASAGVALVKYLPGVCPAPSLVLPTWETLRTRTGWWPSPSDRTPDAQPCHPGSIFLAPACPVSRVGLAG